MKWGVPPLVGLALALLLGSACEMGDGPDRGAEVPTFQGLIELELGKMEGDEDDPELFSHISSIATDAAGRMIVIDGTSQELRVFEPDGRFAFRFGGRGEGPGELHSPCCLGFAPDGRLWVRSIHRYSVFRLEKGGAAYEEDRTRAAAGWRAPVTFDRSGGVIDVGGLWVDGESVQGRYHIGPGGAVDTVLPGTPKDQQVGRHWFREPGMHTLVVQPFGPSWLSAHGPGGAWAGAVSSEYSIALHQPGGDTLRIEGPRLPGPEVTPEERDSAQELLDGRLRRNDLGDPPFGVPGRKPPIAHLYFDRGGRPWVEMSPPRGGEVREADVYDGSALVGRYRWPRRVEAADDASGPWVTGSVLYGVTRDSLDVERVVRVRFERVARDGR